MKWLQLKVETESLFVPCCPEKAESEKENFNEQRISFDVNFQQNSTYTLSGDGIDGSTSNYGEYLRSDSEKNREMFDLFWRSDILNLIGRLPISENVCISQELFDR